MAWTYEQDFESLSAGNLSGQDSWTTGSGAPQVVDTLSYGGGSKSAKLVTNVNSYVKRNITDFTDDGAIGYVSVYSDNNTTSGNSGLYLWDTDGTGRIGDIYINGSSIGKLYFRDEAGTWNEIAPYSNSTWYRLGFEFDFTNNRIRFNIDGGAFGSWFSWSTARSRCGFIWLGSNGGGAANNHYWDEFSADYSSATNITVLPSVQAATFSVPAYAIKTGNTVSPVAQAATFSVPSYTVSLPKVVAPAAQTGTFSIPTYVVDAGGNITLPAAVKTATFSIPAYSVLLDNLIAVSAQSATFSTQTPTLALGSGATITPTAQVTTLSIPTYTITTTFGVVVAAVTQVATFSLPTLYKVGAVWTKVARATSATWNRKSFNDD